MGQAVGCRGDLVPLAGLQGVGSVQPHGIVAGGAQDTLENGVFFLRTTHVLERLLESHRDGCNGKEQKL